MGRDEPVTLTLDGTLVADEESNVTSVVAGRVVDVMVERGSKVQRGAPLIRLRDVDFRLQARAARAQLEQARARLGLEDATAQPPRPEDTPEVRSARSDAELSASTLARTEELAQRGVLAAQELEDARARAASARERYQSALNTARASLGALESANVSLSQANSSAAETIVRAPFAGEIAERMVSVGEYVSAQTQIVRLVSTNPLRIELNVPQQHLQDVRVGQSVSLRIDAVPDHTFTATVRYVSAAVSRESRGLVVEAVVPNDDGLLRPGLYASARLSTGSTHQVAVVPASAILTQAGTDRVFVVHDGTIEERVITVLDRSADGVVVGDGVTAGDRVATGSLDRLADGIRVEVRQGEAPTSPAPEAEPAAATPQPTPAAAGAAG